MSPSCLGRRVSSCNSYHTLCVAVLALVCTTNPSRASGQQLSGPISIIPLYTIDYPIWTGLGNQVWRSSPPTQAPGYNWRLASNSLPTDFLPGDLTVFDDTAGTNTSVNIIAGDVQPASVTFRNNIVSYVISGSNGITGGASLTMNGSGTVTIGNANAYSGSTNLNAGRLNIANSAALGSAYFGATLTINGGTLDNMSGGPLKTDNYPIFWNGGFTFVGSSPLDFGTGNVTLGDSTANSVNVSGSTLTMNGTISGSSSLTKNGAGTLVLTGTNTFNGGVDVLGGKLVIKGAAALMNKSNLSVGAGVSNFSAPTVPGVSVDSQSPSPAATAVPEPGTAALLMAATALAIAFGRRKPA
jgi:autotransporter-associated beta strand protein